MYRSGPMAPVVSGGVSPAWYVALKLGLTFEYVETVGADPPPPPPGLGRFWPTPAFWFAAAFARANSRACNLIQPLGIFEGPPWEGPRSLARPTGNAPSGSPAGAAVVGDTTTASAATA